MRTEIATLEGYSTLKYQRGAIESPVNTFEEPFIQSSYEIGVANQKSLMPGYLGTAADNKFALSR